MLFDDPGPQESTDQSHHLTIGDASGHQVHQDVVVDVVEAGFDVPFDHPLVALGGHLVDLGDGVLCPSSRPIPVTMRIEIDFEDRFQDQFQGHLRHPVPQRRNPQITDLAALLGDRRLPHRQRGETAVFQRRTQLVQKRRHSDVLFDVAARHRVHPCCPGAPVARHPFPGDQQGRLITNQVEHVIEPFVRFVSCPSVQLPLVVKYPPFRPREVGLARSTAIQQ